MAYRLRDSRDGRGGKRCKPYFTPYQAMPSAFQPFFSMVSISVLLAL